MVTPTAFKGIVDFLLHRRTATAREDIVQPCGQLPQVVSVHVQSASNLYRPTFASNFKMDPYMCAYLSGHKESTGKTTPIVFGGNCPVINQDIDLVFRGEPLLILQAFDKDMIHDEFIGEAPLDLLPVINTRQRRWTGPVTVYGQKGTIPHGEILVTLSFKGGDPYDPARPAMHRGELEDGDPGPLFSKLNEQTAYNGYEYEINGRQTNGVSQLRHRAACGCC